ncbi:MAG: hypothetical protein ABSE93_09450 [Terriglobia bacterium]|jgi:hypothetical protein
MRKQLSKRFEVVASILVIAGFAAVAMLANGGRLAYFGHHALNGVNGTVQDHPAIYAENIWKGQSIWTPVAFAADGALTFKDFVDQMFAKTFPQSQIANHKSQMAEGRANLPHYVHVVARHADGTVFLDYWGHNLRTNAGINWQYGQMAGGTAAVCTYIALSNSGATPAATDTALASEITTNGLARALATAAHTSNATSYTLAYTFTATGTQAAQNAGMLNASSSGTLCFENTFTQASLVSGDTLAVTWTITF